MTTIAEPGTQSEAAASRLNLSLATLSFFLCFAAWGLISAFAPRFREQFHLSATQTALLVAVPVLLGALARLAMGVLTDRFGGRVVFASLMGVSAIAVALVPSQTSYATLLINGFFLGLAGSSFAVGVPFVASWTAPERRGGALGIYGLGTGGQSAAVFLGPLLGAAIGMAAVFRLTALLLAVWGALFFLVARNAPRRAQAAPLSSLLAVLLKERLAWALAALYFLTFGGFVAFSIYLPTLLKDQFGLRPTDAGFRAAGFVVLATLMRPIGGWLSDRIGGARVLAALLLAIAPFAMLLAWPDIIPFTVGALGCALLLGLGNGAVFQLVPKHFPNQTGTVTGLVGAVGGLGGFFPPLLLGVLRDRIGVVWPGFALLALIALALFVMNQRVFVAREEATERAIPAPGSRGSDQLRAGFWATLWTGVLIAAIFVGSRRLEHFDAALVVYTFAVVFATWGVVYHYSVWLQKPPTQLYWRRGWELFARGGLRSIPRLGAAVFSHLLAQRFILRRSRLRWWMHQFLFWGCLSAVAITFPLVFGWIHFGTAPGEPMIYVTYLFGFPVGSFPLRTPIAWITFHALDFSAILVLAGISLSLWRRLRDEGALALQSFGADFLPLFLLFAISVTGMALTVSSLWLRGALYGFLAIIHAVTVIAGLLYLPFGKFFHVFQRPAQLGVKLYQQAGDADEGAFCARCGERFASRMHLEDLNQTLRELGFDYRVDGPADTWQGLCPACKRCSLASAQLRLARQARNDTKESIHG